MANPKSPIEWLHDRIAYCENIEDLRSHTLALLLMVDNDQVQDVYQEEMDQDGFFDDYADEPYDDGSDSIDDKETWDTAIEYHLKTVRRKLGR